MNGTFQSHTIFIEPMRGMICWFLFLVSILAGNFKSQIAIAWVQSLEYITFRIDLARLTKQRLSITFLKSLPSTFYIPFRPLTSYCFCRQYYFVVYINRARISAFKLCISSILGFQFSLTIENYRKEAQQLAFADHEITYDA